MRTVLSAVCVLTILAAFGCSSTGETGGGANDVAQAEQVAPPGGGIMPAVADARPAKPAQKASAPRAQPRAGAERTTARSSNQRRQQKSSDVSILRLDQTEVPAEVRAIEKMVDRRSAMLADEVRIEVSKNYEWDVSLAGDGVSPQRPLNGGTVAEASGSPRACFRNLDIRARDKITLWRSGLGVTPFIRIYAKGSVSYIDTDDATGKPRVKRAGNCKINNANIAFDEQILGVGVNETAAQPTGIRDKSN